MPTLPPHHRGGVEHGADDLVIAGAAAQIAGQPIAGVLFGWVLVLVEERPCGGLLKARRAEAALQRGVLEEFLLHRMQRVAHGDASTVVTLRPSPRNAEHQARAHQLAVENDGAGAAIARAAAFLRNRSDAVRRAARRAWSAAPRTETPSARR